MFTTVQGDHVMGEEDERGWGSGEVHEGQSNVGLFADVRTQVRSRHLRIVIKRERDQAALSLSPKCLFFALVKHTNRTSDIP